MNTERKYEDNLPIKPENIGKLPTKPRKPSGLGAKRHFTEDEIAYLCEHFNYYPVSGKIVLRKSGKLIKGSVLRSGYLRVGTALGFIYYHRLAWIIYYGKQPHLTLDHINGNKQDNRICNLRDVSMAENERAKRYKPNKDTGYQGIILKKNRNGKPCGYQTKFNYKVYYFRYLYDAVVFRLEHGLKV